MSMYVIFIIILIVGAFAFFADIMVRRNRRQQESIKASWSDIWSERLKNGR